MTQWYKVNFSNEQVIQGKSTQFLRFQNLTKDTINGIRNIWIMPTCEVLNTLPDEDSDLNDQIFFNGADVINIERVFKYAGGDISTNDPGTNYNKLKNDVGDYVLWSGGPKNGIVGNEAEIFGEIFPNIQEILPGNFQGDKFSLENTQVTDWVNIPVFSDTLPSRDKSEKHSYRIDYNGDKPLVLKIKFLVTTKNPNDTDFVNALPAINPSSTPKVGDIKLDGMEWKHWDGGIWSSFTNPILTSDGNWPTYGIKHLIQEGYFIPGGPNDHWFDYQETYIFCYPKGDYKPSRNNYWVDKELSDKQINDDNSSYMLMRTNPKLSGNIKVVMDSKGTMFMDTIEANDELANAKFKRNKINPKGSFPVDLQRNFSSLDPEVLYDLKERDDQYLNSKRNLFEQYDFFYGYGASQLNNKYYEENYSLFAPIWIKKDLPEFFAIFKVEGSINEESYLENNREELLKKFFEKGKIIKTFDLREGTAFGTYFSNLVNDSRFSEVPMKVSYEENVLSTWSGVSYKDGILANKGEYLYNFFQTDNTIHNFDEFLTRGFERNRMISTNLINMEFLFNDPTSEDYEINRYFGVYFNENELADFEIYPEVFNLISNQTPEPRENIDGEPYSVQPFIQENPDGIVIPVDYIQGSGDIGEPEHVGRVNGKFPLPGSIEDPLRVFYLKDRDNNIQRIKSIMEYEFNTPGASNYTRFSGIELYKKSENISKFSGITKLKSQLKSNLLEAGRSQIVIDFHDLLQDGRPILEDGEKLEIELIDFNNDKQLWQMVANTTGLQTGDFWDFPVYNPDEFLYVNNFSPEGSISDVAKAFAGCVNSFENRLFDAWSNEGTVYIQVKESGDSGNSFIFYRRLIQNSIIENVGFYNINPEHSPMYNLDEQDININTTGNLDNFYETTNLPRLNVYEIKVSNTFTSSYDDYVTFEIRRNGGLIDKSTFKIATYGDLTVSYNDNDISFDIILDDDVIYAENDSWIFKSDSDFIQQRFIGGSKRNRNRASLPNDQILNILEDDWFQAQKGYYSRLKKWNVQGKSIIKIPDLENPTYNEKSILDGFTKFDSHNIIQLDEERFEFYESSQGRIVSFEVFKPKLGLMSILPIKDFDFDFVVSDYAYTPSGEIDTYYGDVELSEGDEYEIPLNEYFKVESGNVSLLGFDSVNEEWVSIENSTGQEISFSQNQNFNTYLPNYYYEEGQLESDCLFDEQGGTNYFYRVYKELEFLKSNNITKLKILANQDSVIEKYTYSDDKDLIEFTGFLGLSDFITSADIIELEDLIENNDPDRFFFGQLLSEYDRLRERFIQDYAVRSKVVPYINKWVERGTDCRDNKYRLNNSLAFGINGFSPDNQIQERNPILHTHEFFYIDEFPSNFDVDLMENSRSYFYDNISDNKVPVNNELKSWYELFNDNSNDWFSKYFTVGYPTELNQEKESVRKRTEERFVFTKFLPGVEAVQGLFRGAKFQIDDINTVTGNVIPGSRKHENYKFSSILRIRSLSLFSNEPPSDIEIIANDKYKTIVMIITLYVNDYRIQDGGYGFLFLYSGVNALRASNQFNENSINSSDTGVSIATTNGNTGTEIIGYDTQRHFNEFIGAGVIDYQDIKLNGIFNTNITANTSPRILEGISNTDKPFIPIEEISPIDNSEYNIVDTFNDNGTSHSSIGTLESGRYSEFSQIIPKVSLTNLRRYIINHQAPENGDISINENSVIISEPFNLGYFALGNTNFTIGYPTRKNNNVPSVNYSDNRNKDYSLWYLSGGKDYLSRRLNEVSFAKISERINTNDPSISYKTITEDGEILNNFSINFIEFDEIKKRNTIQTIEDDDKPGVYRETDLVGFSLDDLQDGDVIFRHRGNFEPKTRKLFNFWVRESESITKHYNLDFLLRNTRIGTEYENFGRINNLYQMKVSDSEIMKISVESEYKPLYPLIQETAIDFKDYMIFNSNWDNDYFDYYENRFGTIKIPGETTPIKREGTLELKEQKAFFGSKLMTTPNLYEFHTFEDEVTFRVQSPLTTTDISQLLDNGENPNLSTVDNDSKKERLIINIESDERVIREMINDNVVKEFIRLRTIGLTRFANFTNEEIEEEAIEYIRKNILKLFKVDEILLYVKEDADTDTDPLFRSDLSELQKRTLGYKPVKDSDVVQLSDFNHEVKINLDSKKYRAYSIFCKIVRR